MTRGLGTLKEAPDPIGPGTAAWEAFDLYVDALRSNEPRGDRRASPAEMRRAYLRKCLRQAGRPEEQDPWCVRAKEMASDPDA